MSGSMPTDISKHPENFYKYAYTSLLRRRVIESCDNVISCGDELERAINELLRDMQEMLYNCTSEEVEAAQQELNDPLTRAKDIVDELPSLIAALRKYKLRLLSSDCN